MYQVDLPPPAPAARRSGPLIIAVVVGLACLVVAGFTVVRAGAELTRPPTVTERNQAAAAELAGRWRSWPAGRIFPATVPYELDLGGEEAARRVGIGKDTKCAAAVDGALAAALTGCRAVLRATYLDQPQGLAITVGVAAFGDERTAKRVAGRLPRGGRPVPGLRALGFPGSVTARFGDAARQRGAVKQRGPYVALATIGYADGRPVAGRQQARTFAAGGQVADRILRPLATPARPDCGSGEWSC